MLSDTCFRPILHLDPGLPMNIRQPVSIATFLAAFFVTGCRMNEPSSDAWRKAEESSAREEWAYTNGMAWPSTNGTNETVMTPGMRITASDSGGQIFISAGEGCERSYTWDSATRSAKLWPRKTRWYGSLGIYFPGPGEHWKSNGGVTRGVLGEGILWFKTADDALAWIKNIQPLKNCVYSNDGLLVAWERVPARKQLNVDVWQIMVAGRRPTDLPGSRDDQLVITRESE